MEKTPGSFLPPHRNGIYIDAIAIGANLVLFPYLLSRVGSLFDRSFSEDGRSFMTLAGLMVFVLFARLFGLYLKRFSLQGRLRKEGRTSFPMYFFVFNIGVFVLNSAFVVVFFSALAAEFGWVETTFDGRPKESGLVMGLGLIAMISLMATEVVLIYRLARPLTHREKRLRRDGNWMFDWRGEFVADFGLFAYMMIWQAFYNDTARLMMTPPENSPDTWEYRIFSMVFLLIVFVIFYVSPRTIFLLHDRKYVGTWVFVFGVYLASVVRYW